MHENHQANKRDQIGLELEFDQMKERKEELEKNNSDLMEIVEHLNDENTELGHRLTAAVTAQEHHEHENELMTEKLTTMEDEVKRHKYLLKDADDAEAEIEKLLDSKLSKYKEDLSLRNEKLQQKEVEIEHLHREMAKLKDKTAVAELERKLEMMTAQREIDRTEFESLKVEKLQVSMGHCPGRFLR